jgi:hypothetical protein
MTTFDKQEQAYEAHFAQDQESEFKAQARRNRRLAYWAGERMGLSGAELDAYVPTVQRADLVEAGDDDVFQKVLADLNAKNTQVSPAELRAKMDELLVAARQEIKEGPAG